MNQFVCSDLTRPIGSCVMAAELRSKRLCFECLLFSVVPPRHVLLILLVVDQWPMRRPCLLSTPFITTTTHQVPSSPSREPPSLLLGFQVSPSKTIASLSAPPRPVCSLPRFIYALILPSYRLYSFLYACQSPWRWLLWNCFALRLA